MPFKSRIKVHILFKLKIADFKEYIRRVKKEALRRREERRYFFILLISLPFTLQAAPGFHEPWGKDSDLKISIEAPTPKSKPSPMAYFAEQMIFFHQRVISPVDGPRSHFRPGSSEFMRLAIAKHGFIQGFIMGCDRLLRENSDPWVYRTIETEGAIFKSDFPK